MFPTKWKLAKVTAIPKDADYKQASNNRPFSLLPIVLKGCEKDFYDQFASYLTSKQKQEIPFNRNVRH